MNSKGFYIWLVAASQQVPGDQARDNSLDGSIRSRSYPKTCPQRTAPATVSG